MNYKNILMAISAMALIVFNISCSSDDEPDPVNEEEVITTMTVTLAPQTGGSPIMLQTRDLDGDGPNPPVVTVSGPLTADKAYNGTIELLNETVSPVENITTEVAAEGDEHQFFYQTVGGLDLTTTYADQDGDGNPVGILFTLETGDASTGSLTVVLRHEPDKDASGVSDGDIGNAGGETDISASFSVEVQ